jgi:hypothetical protein
MRRIQSIAWVWAVFGFVLALPMTAQTVDPDSFLIVRDPTNFLRNGTETIVRANVRGVRLSASASDSGGNETIERVRLTAHDPASPNDTDGDPDFELFFTRSTGINKGGVIPTRNGEDNPDAAVLEAHLRDRTCTALRGSATGLSDFQLTGFGSSSPTITRIRGQFAFRCATTGGEVTVGGEFYFGLTDVTGREPGTGGNDDDGDDDDGDDGDDDGGDDDGDGDDDEPEPEPEQPSFTLNLPTEVSLGPIAAANATSHTFQISTEPNAVFNDDIHFVVMTSAGEAFDFHAEVTPSMIPAPGRGNATVTIRTGPLTMPRDYVVTVYAMSDDKVVAQSFIVRVDCTPPFILGVDQPKSVAGVNAGSQTTLSVAPGGSGPFFYQWYRGERGMTSNPLAAENDPTLMLTARETGPYWVRVRNACGSVDSNAAMVFVNPAPPTTRFMRRSSNP